MPIIDPKKVAPTNPSVDLAKLEALERINQTLDKAGARRKAEYRLSPPLSDPGKQPTQPAAKRMSR